MKSPGPNTLATLKLKAREVSVLRWVVVLGTILWVWRAVNEENMTFIVRNIMTKAHGVGDFTAYKFQG